MRVLVTRPEPQAGRTATGLRSLGHEPVILPLTQIRPIAIVPRPEWFSAGLVAVTSANALAGLTPEFLEPFLDLRCYAVGAATVLAANEAGFGDAVEGPGDAEALADLIEIDGDPQASVLYFCGKVRTPGFEAVLAEAGREVFAAETYDTVPAVISDGQADAAFASPFGAVLLHSALSAEALTSLMGREQIGTSLGEAAFLCLSERIAAVLPDSLKSRARIAAAPTEDALLSLLRAV